MPADVFLDTNILLYAVSNNPAEKQERQIARQLLENENWAISVQVLQEFYVNATGKLAKTLPETETMQFISHLMQRPVVTTSPDLFLHAVALKNRYQLSYWDAAIIAAAHALHCHTLYTQDLNHEQDYDGVTAINPFNQ